MRWGREEEGLDSQRVAVMTNFMRPKMVNNNTNHGITKRKRLLKSRASKNQRKESICGLSER